MIRGSVLLAACVGLWSCSSDSTADQAGVPDKIVSLPSVVFVKQDSSELVAFQLVDALDGQIPTAWTVSANSPLFSVAFDSTFRPIYNADGTLTLPGQQTEARATVTGVALGIDTLTVSAGGKTLDVIVNVVPGTLHVTFSPANPAPGDTVTMTMPADLLLSQTSAVTFTGNLAPIIVDRAADSTSLRFISAPTTATNATVTKVWDTNFPTLPAATYNTEDKVVGTMSGAFTGFLPATFSTLAPSGPPVIMTMNAGFGVMPTTVISFTGQTAPIINNADVTGDSTVVDFSVGPNVNQKVNVSQVYAKGAPQFLYTLESAGYMVSPVITNFAATVSTNTPQIAQPITLTAGPGFSFGPGARVTFGTNAAVVTANSGATLTIEPAPGSSGMPSVTNVISAAFPAFPIPLPAVLPAGLAMLSTVAPALAGTGSYATAPLIGSQGVYDAGGMTGGAECGWPCNIYTLNVTAAGPQNFTLNWSNNTDLGLYFLDPTLTYLPENCDAGGSGAAGHPENCTVDFPAPGVYYLEVDSFGPAYPGGEASNPRPAWLGIYIF